MATVTAYWRPLSIARAFELLERPDAVVLGGGTKLHARPAGSTVEVVDLQALRLDGIEHSPSGPLSIGSMATLQQVAHCAHAPAVVREAARREQPSTVRSQATIGGCIATGDAESELLAVLLVHEAVVHLDGGAGLEDVPLADLLAALPLRPRSIVLGITIQTSGVAAVARTARTPADKPIVAAAARFAPGARLTALTGVASTPVLVDGTDGLDPPGDFRGSSEYRRALAATLLDRAVEALR